MHPLQLDHFKSPSYKDSQMRGEAGNRSNKYHTRSQSFLQVYAWKLTVHRDLVQSKVIPVYDSKLRSHTHAEIKEEIKLEIHLTCTYI